MAYGHCEGGVNLVANDYSDVIVLTIASGACLYVVCYLSKWIERTNFLRKVFSIIGRDSLYIMAFHFIGFKVGSEILKICGVSVKLWQLVPGIGQSVFFLLYYMIFGVEIPLTIIFLVRRTRSLTKRIVKI